MRTNLALLLLAMAACAPMDCGGPVVSTDVPGTETDSDLPLLPLETPVETPVDAQDEVTIT